MSDDYEYEARQHNLDAYHGERELWEMESAGYLEDFNTHQALVYGNFLPVAYVSGELLTALFPRP